MIDRRIRPRLVAGLAVATACMLTLCACGQHKQASNGQVRVGLVAKSLGNGFFAAVDRGAEEAAAALNAEVIFTGPTTPTAEGQIEVINALIAQHVDAVVLSANDPDALVPVLQRAMQRGIKVITYDSTVTTNGRMVHVAASSEELIGHTCAQLAAELSPGGQGRVAVVSATPTSTNQNSWLGA